DALTAKKNEEFQEEQEMLETGLAGRGIIPGGGYVDGGLRKKPEDVNKKVAGGY
ncbi:MAG: hypothetical protein GY731_08195, partial [Gammaproteobacteria bacterium]|nr:hypothetical protein [Gammaproteobacteria bacterium]